ncbi:MAG TPA: TIGR03000 domain-containing protein, partial [Gemmataceae bacterium]|nr:TIGR03000 domain-containing protein [Gemmataceae bacterium]
SSTLVASADPTTATIVVSLPADAKLSIDDQPTTSTSAQRVFVSPSLPTGKDFYYTLKAEITVDGKPTVVSQVVKVRAGEESRVTLAAATGVAER